VEVGVGQELAEDRETALAAAHSLGPVVGNGDAHGGPPRGTYGTVVLTRRRQYSSVSRRVCSSGTSGSQPNSLRILEASPSR